MRTFQRANYIKMVEMTQCGILKKILELKLFLKQHFKQIMKNTPSMLHISAYVIFLEILDKIKQNYNEFN